jgi:hypothetical protein
VPIKKQFSVMVENKRGALAQVCSRLAEKAVNILALMVPEQSGLAPIRLVVSNDEAAKKILDSMGSSYTEEDVLAVEVSDKPGALGKVTRKLADHNIDVKYAYGTIEKGVEKAMIVMGVSDLQAAVRVLKLA